MFSILGYLKKKNYLKYKHNIFFLIWWRTHINDNSRKCPDIKNYFNMLELNAFKWQKRWPQHVELVSYCGIVATVHGEKRICWMKGSMLHLQLHIIFFFFSFHFQFSFVEVDDVLAWRCRWCHISSFWLIPPFLYCTILSAQLMSSNLSTTPFAFSCPPFGCRDPQGNSVCRLFH